MKRVHPIDKQRAIQRFRKLAQEKNPTIQMILPLAGIAGLLQEGVGNLLPEAGLCLMKLVMEEEVRQVAGERYRPQRDRHVHRWGKEDGFCVVDGQKAPIRRARLRTKENREYALGSYEMFQRSAPLEHTVWDKMMLRAVDARLPRGGAGFSRGLRDPEMAVSENFIAASYRESRVADFQRKSGQPRLEERAYARCAHYGRHLCMKRLERKALSKQRPELLLLSC